MRTRGEALARRLGLEPRELAVLVAIVLAGLALRVAYVLVTHDHPLVGDEPEYNSEARFIADGKWFWTTVPYGIPHASMWKAPGYPAFLGVLYSLFGVGPFGARFLQSFVGAITIVLTFMLGRRLLGPRSGLAAAAIVAVYPLAWQFDVLLYPESLAAPLMIGLLLLFLERDASPRLAALAGVVAAVGILVRPTSFFVLPAVALTWLLTSPGRRGALCAAITVLAAVVVVAPWTIRNHHVSGGFIPVSIQDAALYGTFNDDAAHDPVYPWAWRPLPSRDRDIVASIARVTAARTTSPAKADPPLSDLQFRRELIERGRRYIADHPSSLVKAFFWNGLSRYWDVRRPQRVIDDAVDGRSKAVTGIGIAIYYVLFPLALLGLWRLRSRRALVLPILLLALGASVVFTTASGTRYRAPLEPLIAVLACAGAAGAWERLRGRRASGDRELGKQTIHLRRRVLPGQPRRPGET